MPGFARRRVVRATTMVEMIQESSCMEAMLGGRMRAKVGEGGQRRAKAERAERAQRARRAERAKERAKAGEGESKGEERRGRGRWQRGC